MNKFVQIKQELCNEPEFIDIEFWVDMNKVLEETHGLKRYDGGGIYYIQDEVKFSLFMLKYPEHIRKISYE
jgi:hypothetical protein